MPGAAPENALNTALNTLRERVERVYPHVDLDVLDASIGRPNAYAAPGGPNLDGVLAAIAQTFARFDVDAAALTAYDPRLDDGGTIAAAARASPATSQRLPRTSAHLTGTRPASTES